MCMCSECVLEQEVERDFWEEKKSRESLPRVLSMCSSRSQGEVCVYMVQWFGWKSSGLLHSSSHFHNTHACLPGKGHAALPPFSFLSLFLCLSHFPLKNSSGIFVFFLFEHEVILTSIKKINKTNHSSFFQFLSVRKGGSQQIKITRGSQEKANWAEFVHSKPLLDIFCDSQEFGFPLWKKDHQEGNTMEWAFTEQLAKIGGPKTWCNDVILLNFLKDGQMPFWNRNGKTSCNASVKGCTYTHNINSLSFVALLILIVLCFTLLQPAHRP